MILESSGVFHIRCHWKCDIVDTFTHHFYANGHGWTMGTSFPYIRRVKRQHSPQCKYIAFCLIYCPLHLLYSLHSTLLNTFYKVSIPACVLHHVLCNRLWALPQGIVVQHHGFRPSGLSMMTMTLGMLAMGITCPKGLLRLSRDVLRLLGSSDYCQQGFWVM